MRTHVLVYRLPDSVHMDAAQDIAVPSEVEALFSHQISELAAGVMRGTHTRTSSTAWRRLSLFKPTFLISSQVPGGTTTMKSSCWPQKAHGLDVLLDCISSVLH